MGTPVSLVKFVGRIGNVLTYYLNDELVSRTIGKVDLEKMRTAPQYEETRKNQFELGVASSGGKLFREGLLQFTKGYTIHSYASDVVQILINTLRSDMTQPKGQKQITNGLKNVVSQLAFSKLNIFSKRETSFYKNTLLRKTNDGKSWRLNRNILFGKGVNGDQMSVKIGYYHVDFEGQVANYEHAFSIACHRNEKIEFSDFTLPKPKETSTGWTFIIMQVWREGTIQDITGMTYMSVLDVVENEVTSRIPEIEEGPLEHKCGLEITDAQSLAILAHKGEKTAGMKKEEISVARITHGHSMFREDMVKFGGHDWDDVIKKVLK